MKTLMKVLVLLAALVLVAVLAWLGMSLSQTPFGRRPEQPLGSLDGWRRELRQVHALVESPRRFNEERHGLGLPLVHYFTPDSGAARLMLAADPETGEVVLLRAELPLPADVGLLALAENFWTELAGAPPGLQPRPDGSRKAVLDNPELQGEWTLSGDGHRLLLRRGQYEPRTRSMEAPVRNDERASEL